MPTRPQWLVAARSTSALESIQRVRLRTAIKLTADRADMQG